MADGIVVLVGLACVPDWLAFALLAVAGVGFSVLLWTELTGG